MKQVSKIMTVNGQKQWRCTSVQPPNISIMIVTCLYASIVIHTSECSTKGAEITVRQSTTTSNCYVMRIHNSNASTFSRSPPKPSGTRHTPSLWCTSAAERYSVKRIHLRSLFDTKNCTNSAMTPLIPAAAQVVSMMAVQQRT